MIQLIGRERCRPLRITSVHLSALKKEGKKWQYLGGMLNFPFFFMPPFNVKDAASCVCTIRWHGDKSIPAETEQDWTEQFCWLKFSFFYLSQKVRCHRNHTAVEWGNSKFKTFFHDGKKCWNFFSWSKILLFFFECQKNELRWWWHVGVSTKTRDTP